MLKFYKKTVNNLFKLNKPTQKFVRHGAINWAPGNSPGQIPLTISVEKPPRKILSPINILNLNTESGQFESADENEIFGDENLNPITSKFVNQNKIAEKIDIKTECLPEISNEAEREYALLKLTCQQFEELLITKETSDRNENIKKDMKLAEVMKEQGDLLHYYDQTRNAYHDLGLVKNIRISI